MSNLTKALAVVSLLAPVSAQPLGIGEIELHSALNQKLNAEIRLSVAPGENPADVSVKLAPPEKFDQAGVVWNYFLSKIKLEPVVQANGSIIVKVSSREALTEPFLDFLLEVTWPQGSMMREFTLLIDPPTAYNQPVTPVVETSGYSAEPIEPLERPIKRTRTAPKRAVRAAPADNITPETPTSGEFGPIQKSDTLWSIAAQVGQEKNIPTQKMLTALYKANPDAFNNGNINSLKEGTTLKIPEPDTIMNPAQRQAQNERKATNKQVKPDATQAETKKALELVAPTEAKAAGTGSTKTEQNSAATANPALNSAADQASEGKDLELQARIEKLEQQLGMMQQLLALKDQQLATLQNNKPATTEPSPQPAQPAPQPPVASPEPQTPAVTPAPQPSVSEPAVVTPPAPKPVVPPAPKVTPPPPPPVVAEDEGLFGSDAYYWVAGTLGTGILGLLGWLLWRKRKIDERTNTESMFASASQIRLPDSESSLSVPIMDISSTDDYDVGTVGESSFISDFTPSDFDAFDTDQNEVDPISEADVYLAYGRYQQAEELIRHAISEQPNRDECKLKLLEIYYASENKDGFAGYAQELADAGKQADKPFWKKVTDMAKEIVPDLALFGGSFAATTAPTSKSDTSVDIASSTAADTEIIDLDKSFALLDDDLSDLDIDKDLALEDNGLDFDLGSFGGSAKSPLESKQADASIESIDFDQPPASKSAAETIETTESNAVSSNDDIESFDFDFALDTDSEKTQADSAALELESLDFANFAEIAADAESETADNKEEMETLSPSSMDALESFDFNFDVDNAAPEATADKTTEDAAKAEISHTDIESFDFNDFNDIKKTTSDLTDTSKEALADADSFNFDFDSITPKAKTDDSLSIEPELNLESQLKLETFDFSDFDNITPKSAQSSDQVLETSAQPGGEFDFNFDFDTPIISTTDNDEFELGVSDLTDMDEFETKIDLAKAYIDMGDTEAAKLIAEDVLSKGSKQQQQAAQALLDELK
ncbi:FimV/HubP family polar landmark protein [Methylomonas fluvii]|uniref:Fimbrial protein FimV n=1 Tax=Methylomonas fluvii TaxID=1854564 RepID=A0ABR9DJ65_9GAMM|nr:FimV/HubP family polar landmark protein [Methylomonas fluvii]MBD9361927.1 fimbrial protein FimV [Methylomonas fluvii]